MAEIKEKERRVEEKKRKCGGESFVGEEKKKKEAKSVTLTAADLQCENSPSCRHSIPFFGQSIPRVVLLSVQLST